MIKSHTNNFNNTDSENSYGVVLSTRPITAYSQKPGANSTKTPAEDVIQESPWTLTNMLERFSFKSTYDWPSSSISHTVLAKLRVPQDLIVNTITNAPFEVFNFWRGDVETRIQVTGTPFHQGMLAAVFVPLVTEQVNDQILQNFSSMSVNPTVYLFPNANTNAVLKIPYNHFNQYLDLTDLSQSLGYLSIVVFNKLELAAGASDTVTVSLFSRFLGSEFKVPRKTSSALFAIPESSDKVQHKIHSATAKALADIADMLYRKTLLLIL